MENFQINSNSQNEEIPACKRQRLKSLDQSATMMPITKIIDLNDDCLVKIFEPLDLCSLFNVAIASEWLRPAARMAYKRSEFGAKHVEIDKCDDFCKPNTRLRASINRTIFLSFKLDEYCKDIRTNGLKMALQYLRCFGPSITINNLLCTTDQRANHSSIYIYTLASIALKL